MGIDTLKEFHQHSLSHFAGDPKASFIYADFMDYEFQNSQKLDWSFCVGTLAAMQENKDAYDVAFVKKMRSLSTRGMTFYINDRSRMKAERLKQVKDLVDHDVPWSTQLLKDVCNTDIVDLTRFPGDDVSCALTARISA